MVLARNTYRFGLLVIAFSIAEGVRTMGGYGANLAGLGLLVGSLGLFGGTLAHFARGPPGDGNGGTDPKTGGDDGNGDDDAEAEAEEETVDRMVPHRSMW